MKFYAKVWSGIILLYYYIEYYTEQVLYLSYAMKKKTPKKLGFRLSIG